MLIVEKLELMLQRYVFVLLLDPEFQGLGELPALPCEYCTYVIVSQHNIRLQVSSFD